MEKMNVDLYNDLMNKIKWNFMRFKYCQQSCVDFFNTIIPKAPNSIEFCTAEFSFSPYVIAVKMGGTYVDISTQTLCQKGPYPMEIFDQIMRFVFGSEKCLLNVAKANMVVQYLIDRGLCCQPIEFVKPFGKITDLAEESIAEIKAAGKIFSISRLRLLRHSEKVKKGIPSSGTAIAIIFDSLLPNQMDYDERHLYFWC